MGTSKCEYDKTDGEFVAGMNLTSVLAKLKNKWDICENPSFDDLSACIMQTHKYAQTSALRAVNQLATMRNWLIGFYIVEYEQNGEERAKYGERLLKSLEEKVRRHRTNS